MEFSLGGIGADTGVPVERDTIVAVSTAAGAGAIGIVRMSGPEAIAIAAEAFVAHHGGDIRSADTFTLSYGHVVDGATELTLDEVLVGVMRAPRSYTREDVVEVHCHGGVLAVRSVLQLLVRLGARVAEPGEFTRRAFINGRIDLAQAESVAAVVAARSTGALRASLQQLGGGLSERVSYLRSELIAILAGIEASVDFSDEDVEDIDWVGSAKRLEQVRGGLEELLRTALLGRALEYGVRVAIVGRPNAGKSSLLNALVMKERAIVSDTPGTTRDTVEDELEIAGIPIRLVDTAGLRMDGDGVERLGIERSLQALEEADLVLVVVDLADMDEASDQELIERAWGRPCVVVGNKSDLVGSNGSAFGRLCAVVEATRNNAEDTGGPLGGGMLWVRAASALGGEGIESLRQLIGEVVTGGAVDMEEPILVGERQRQLVTHAAACVEQSLSGVEGRVDEELIAEDTRAAIEALGRLTGEDLSADLVDEIFSRFCLGK